MIVGLGIDSVEIDRVAEKCSAPGSKFAEKMFTEMERARAAKKLRAPYEHLAACFAAREAFYKATQLWYKRQEVSVAQTPYGEPYYVLSDEMKAKLGQRVVHLSLTHDRSFAQAICICEELE